MRSIQFSGFGFLAIVVLGLLVPSCGSSTGADIQGVVDDGQTQLQGVPSPVVTSPSPLIFTSSNPFQNISGSCIDGDTILFGGDIATNEVVGGSLSVTCSSSHFSLGVFKSSDGTYTITVTQQDPGGDMSNPVTIIWTLSQ